MEREEHRLTVYMSTAEGLLQPRVGERDNLFIYTCTTDTTTQKTVVSPSSRAPAEQSTFFQTATNEIASLYIWLRMEVFYW